MRCPNWICLPVWMLRSRHDGLPIVLFHPSINFRCDDVAAGQNSAGLARTYRCEPVGERVKIVNQPRASHKDCVKDFVDGAGGDKYEQAIQGLFTTGTSGFRDPYKTDDEGRKEKVGCKQGLK